MAGTTTEEPEMISLHQYYHFTNMSPTCSAQKKNVPHVLVTQCTWHYCILRIGCYVRLQTLHRP